MAPQRPTSCWRTLPASPSALHCGLEGCCFIIPLSHMFWKLPSPGWPCDDCSWPRSRVAMAQDPPPATRSSSELGGCSGPTVSPPTALTSGSPGHNQLPKRVRGSHVLGHPFTGLSQEAHSTPCHGQAGSPLPSLHPGDGVMTRPFLAQGFSRESWIQRNKCSGPLKMLALQLVSPCVCLVFLAGPEYPQKPR